MFCELLKEPPLGGDLILEEDDRVRVSHVLDEDGPSARGSVLVVVKRHTENGLADLTDQEGAAVGRSVARVSRALREVLGVPWTYTYCFTEGFRHVHQFVQARYPGLPEAYLRLRISEWPELPTGGPQEIRALAASLRKAIARPPTAP